MDHEDRPEGRLPSHAGLRQPLEILPPCSSGVVYQFRVLPFGLSTAPVVQLLRTQGVRIQFLLGRLNYACEFSKRSLEHTQQNFQLLQVERSTQTRQCYNPHTFWTFWFYISTWNEPLFLLQTLSYQLSPMSYPVCLHQRSCLLAKFHPSAGCHILPRSYTVAVFTYAFSSSGSKPSGLTISSRGIHQSSWMWTSSPTFTGFTDEMWWQAFRYIFRNPACSSLRMHPWRDGAPVGKTIRYPDYGSSRITTSYPLARTGSHTTCATSLGTSVAQSICESLLRKQYSSSVHPHTEGNTFSVPVLQDPGTVRSPGSVCDNSPENPKILGNHGHHDCIHPGRGTRFYSCAYILEFFSRTSICSSMCPTSDAPKFHRDPRLLNLASWKLSGTSWKAIIPRHCRRYGCETPTEFLR